MQLIQDRLDVKNKTRANLFNWRGQFTPQFVDYILETFTSKGDVVVDPFSGSGTVLLESARKGLSCYGFEVNPAAYAMSKFFSFSNLPHYERTELFLTFQRKVNNILNKHGGLSVFTPQHSFRDSYANLLNFSMELFSQPLTSSERVLAINTVFTAEDYRDGGIVSTVSRATKHIQHCFTQLPYTNEPITACLGDARLLHKHCPVPVNVILTSPPYINVFNYHQNHRAIVESLGWNILDIAQSEIGSNRKNRINRFKTVVQYCLDMELTLASFWQSMDNDGIVVMVIGRESNVRRIPFYNGEIVKDIANSMCAFRDIQNYTRTFTNKFGVDIKEDIVVLKKSNASPRPSVARDVSMKHLESSLKIAPEEAKEDILNTISSIDMIQPSPYLSPWRDYLDDKDAP